MTQHVGHDHLSGYGIRVGEIDAATHAAAIRHGENAGLPGAIMIDPLTCTETPASSSCTMTR